MNRLERLQALEQEDVDTVRFVQALVDAAPDLIRVALAAIPYLEKAAPGEHLFDGQDLRTFQALQSALAPLLESEAGDA